MFVFCKLGPVNSSYPRSDTEASRNILVICSRSMGDFEEIQIVRTLFRGDRSRKNRVKRTQWASENQLTISAAHYHQSGTATIHTISYFRVIDS